MQQQTYDNFTDIKIVDFDALPELNEALEQQIIKYVNHIWDKSVSAREDVDGYKLRERIEEIKQADRLEHTEPIKNKPEYRSKSYLPWIQNAHDAVTAYLAAMLISGNWHSFLGNTQEDKKNAEYASKYIGYLWENNYEFRKTIIHAIRQCVVKGQTCVKGFWQLIKSYQYDYNESVNEQTGQTEFARKKQEITLYNDMKLDFVDMDDFQFYPVNKPLCEVTQIHRTEVKYSDLQANTQGRWINLDKVEKKYSGQKGVEETPIYLKEAWINECYLDVNGEKQKINRVIVTTCDDILIEYKPNFLDYGLTPFSWTTFEPITGTNLGKGLCFDAYDLEQTAIMLFNALLDSVKIGVYPMLVVPEGRNPQMFTPRPGGLIPWPEVLFEKGILPKPFGFDVSKVPITFETVMALKKEFEAATVPEFIKGVRPDRDETATRDMLVQQGSENKLTIVADNFNEEILKPVLRLQYCLYRMRSQVDMEVRLKIAKLCIDHTTDEELVDPITGQAIGKIMREKFPEEILKEFPEILPLEKIDIKVCGYKNNAKKAETIRALQSLIPMIANADDYTKMKIDQDSLLKTYLLNLNLDSEDIVFSDEEAMQNELKKIQALGQLEIQRKLTMQGVIPNVQGQQVSGEAQRPMAAFGNAQG